MNCSLVLFYSISQQVQDDRIRYTGIIAKTYMQNSNTTQSSSTHSGKEMLQSNISQLTSSGIKVIEQGVKTAPSIVTAISTGGGAWVTLIPNTVELLGLIPEVLINAQKTLESIHDTGIFNQVIQQSKELGAKVQQTFEEESKHLQEDLEKIYHEIGEEKFKQISDKISSIASDFENKDPIEAVISGISKGVGIVVDSLATVSQIGGEVVKALNESLERVGEKTRELTNNIENGFKNISGVDDLVKGVINGVDNGIKELNPMKIIELSGVPNAAQVSQMAGIFGAPTSFPDVGKIAEQAAPIGIGIAKTVDLPQIPGLDNVIKELGSAMNGSGMEAAKSQSQSQGQGQGQGGPGI